MRRRASRISRFAPLFACITLAALATAAPAAAATFRVDRTDDAPTTSDCDDATPGDCSLRGAVIKANAAEEPSTIELPAGTYPLSESVPCTFRSIAHPFPATESLTSLCLTGQTAIVGAGAELTKLDGQLATRILYVSLDAEVEVAGVTFERGAPADFTPLGGAIWNDGLLTLRESVLRANQSIAEGGAISSGGTLRVYGSTFEGNLGRNGGAAWLRGPTTIEDSRFTDNSAGTGGALAVFRPTNSNIPFAMTGSLVDGNESALGAIWMFGVDAVITNTTISGNGGVGPALHGAGLRADLGTLDLRNVTITDNVGNVGGGLSVLSAEVRMRNTLIAGNHAATTGSTDCNSQVPIVSEGYNLVEDITGCSITGDATGNVIGADALLGPLAANGGPTLTHSPAPAAPRSRRATPGCPAAAAARARRSTSAGCYGRRASAATSARSRSPRASASRASSRPQAATLAPCCCARSAAVLRRARRSDSCVPARTTSWRTQSRSTWAAPRSPRASTSPARRRGRGTSY